MKTMIAARSLISVVVILLSLAAPVLAGWDGYADFGIYCQRSHRNLSKPELSLTWTSPAYVVDQDELLSYLDQNTEFDVSDFVRSAPDEFTMTGEDGSRFEGVQEVDAKSGGGTRATGFPWLDVYVGGWWHYPEEMELEPVYAEAIVSFQSNGRHRVQIKLQRENRLTER
jgi:hypothetical protein